MSELIKLDEKFNGEIDALGKTDAPDKLFHYTDARGLLGILDTNCLWATNYRFLNDSSEFIYSRNLFNEVVDLLLEEKPGAKKAKFLQACRMIPFVLERDLDGYVICFSAHADLVNQWRDYAASGGGYAVEFHPDNMLEGLDDFNKDGVFFKVHYNRTEQINLFRSILNDYLTFWLEHGDTDLNSEFPLAGFDHYISVKVAWVSMFFKHPAFRAENEWRLCFIGASFSGVKFRAGMYGVTPYLECSFMRKSHPKASPVTGVHIGPTTDKETAKHSLRMLLDSKDCKSTRIEASDLPVRKA